ncbi:MAG TPA: tetratricopeptide repeat protein [Polyangium sp.]|nr:tetratricopeptide repeat protein [Polyangium sp.]
MNNLIPQSQPRIFLCHAPSETTDIYALRRALEDRGLAVIVGDKSSKARALIASADAFIVLLSQTSIGNEIVQREVKWAIEAHGNRTELHLVALIQGFPEPTGVASLLFKPTTPVCLPIPEKGIGIVDTAKKILEAIGLSAKNDDLSQDPEPMPPLAELALKFSQPRLVMVDNKPRASATLRLRYSPPAGLGIDGVPIEFTSPLGPKESEDLRWYIESYCDLLWGPFNDMGKAIEAKLPQWGQLLFAAIAARQERPMRAFIEAKADPGERLEKRITMNVEYRNANAEGATAAALLFGLPWELLHDERSYLFDGAAAIRVRRTLPSENVQPPIAPRARVRVLLVRARPEVEGAKFIDPRSSVLPLAEVLHDLGERVTLDLLPDGTFQTLQKFLQDAEDKRDPYQIVHFDGHGSYDEAKGQGCLHFEDAEDARNGFDKRRAHPVYAKDIGGTLRDRRLSLFVLDACQTGRADKNVDTSVAAELLRQGVVSVVAMRYAVIAGTARRFVKAFYGSLASGHRIGRAMLDAQRALKGNAFREERGSFGRLELQDWMVPVLFQENEDSQIFVRGIDRRPTADEDRKRVDATRRGELPQNRKHGFVGRARELLNIERRLVRNRRVAIVGAAGGGKTALAIEAANWFLLTQQRERVAFVSVERLSDSRAVLDAIGRQLVAGYSVATAEAAGDNPIIAIKSALMQRKTLLVVDNFESLLAFAEKETSNQQALREIMELVHALADVHTTWLLTTSRESLPAPLDGREWRIPSLSAPDARELLGSVLREHNFEPPRDSEAAKAMETSRDELIEAVYRHARSLVLLGPTIVGQGFEPTRDAIRRAMVDLERQYPDDRERSLLASVQVSLARLDEATRKKIAPLCVFRQAANVVSMAKVLEVQADEALELCRRLVGLGLANENSSYLVPDPALGAALALELAPEVRVAAEKRWREEMAGFARALYEEHFQDARIAAHGTTIILLDLLDALEETAALVQMDPESVDGAMQFATDLESLTSKIGHPRALERVRTVREALMKNLTSWTRGRFVAESAEIDRRFQNGNMVGALEVAERVYRKAEEARDAYPGARYDLALAGIRLGRIWQVNRKADVALSYLKKAGQRFAALAALGDQHAARMEYVAITEQGHVLLGLGQTDAAASKYEDAIARAASSISVRDRAVQRTHIAMLRLQQRRFGEALAAYEQARDAFNSLGEPDAVAGMWHQIGRVQEEANQFAAAECAYKEALRIKISLGNRAGEASTLGQLGNLDRLRGRHKEAAIWYRKAIALYEELGDGASAAMFRSNLGVVLYDLGQLGEARELLKAALAVKLQLGPAAEPWKTWQPLAKVEHDAKRPDEAAHARAQAISTYRAYRLAGGDTIDGQTSLVVAMGALLTQKDPDAAGALLQKLHAVARNQAPEESLALVRALDAIVAGERDPKLAEDPELDPMVVVELQLLLEKL